MHQAESLGLRTIGKIKWRLIPFLFVLYIINVIDRGNLSYAALTMNAELNISPAAFGALSSIFFIPYFLFEVPSNMLLHRFGARKWIARIMVSWGIATSAAMFSHSFAHIATVRFFLGMMEAGFFPGVMFYFTLWFPQRERAKVIAFFMMALPVATFISSPMSGWVLDFMAMAAAVMAAWTVIIIKDFAKVSNTQVGLLGMLPSLFAMIAMPLWAWHSDKTGERKIHSVISLAVAFAGVSMTALTASPVIKMIGLVLFFVGSTSIMGPFWTIPTLFLTGASAAIGTAVINSCNAFGGFFATFISGFIQGRFGFTGVLWFVSMCYMTAILLTATLPLKHQKTESIQAVY